MSNQKQFKRDASGSDQSDSEQGFSGPGSEAETLTWQDARRFKLAFGKYKGKRLESMIKSKKRRDYIKYLLEWDKLRDDTRANIQAAMEHYEELKAARE